MNSVLKTSRLVLRPLTSADAEAFWPIVSDPEVPRFMSWEAATSIDQTLEFLASTEDAFRNGTSIRWAITVNGQMAGMVALEQISRTLRAWRIDRAELAYYLGRPDQGLGYATEAATEVLRFAFEDLVLHKVTVDCIADNAASLRVISKLGFRFVGEQRQHVFRFGRWWDQHTHELLRDDWCAATRPPERGAVPAPGNPAAGR